MSLANTRKKLLGHLITAFVNYWLLMFSFHQDCKNHWFQLARAAFMDANELIKKSTENIRGRLVEIIDIAWRRSIPKIDQIGLDQEEKWGKVPEMCPWTLKQMERHLLAEAKSP